MRLSSVSPYRDETLYFILAVIVIYLSNNSYYTNKKRQIMSFFLV